MIIEVNLFSFFYDVVVYFVVGLGFLVIFYWGLV